MKHIERKLARMIGAAVVAVFLAPSVFGQLQTDRVLVPVVAQNLPGAFGSVWRTELVGYTNSDKGVTVETVFGGCALPEGCAASEQHPPGQIFRPAGFGPGSVTGTFMYVSSTVAHPADLVSFDLRVRDMSRQDQTWGTSIPVIRERQTYKTPLHLLSVPVDSRFRNSLRIYDFNTSEGSSVRLRIFDENSTVLVDSVINLPPSVGFSHGQPVLPGAIFIGNLTDAFPQLADLRPDPLGPQEPRVHVQIDPITSGMEFWAMVSVTNNETQHVTLVTPDPPSSR